MRNKIFLGFFLFFSLASFRAYAGQDYTYSYDTSNCTCDNGYFKEVYSRDLNPAYYPLSNNWGITYLCNSNVSMDTTDIRVWGAVSGDYQYGKVFLIERDCVANPVCDENQTLDTSVNPPICRQSCDEGMTDNGNGCECDDSLVPNPEGGCYSPPDCKIDDPNSEYSPFAFKCVCEEKSIKSPYTGLCVPYCGHGTNDTDCDNIPNDEDDDLDNDGIPNDQDSDADGDGIDNDQDSSPNGGSSESTDCGTDRWNEALQTCVPYDNCPTDMGGCIYNVIENASYRVLRDCVGHIVETYRTFGDCDEAWDTCRDGEYSCKGNCIPSGDQCTPLRDDITDLCSQNDFNSYSINGTCVCRAGYHKDDFGICKIDDAPQHDTKCDYPSSKGGYLFQQLVFSRMSCDYFINFFNGGTSDKSLTCDYFACYYNKESAYDENGTYSPPDSPSLTNEDGSLEDTLGDGRGNADANTTGDNNAISDFGLFENIKNDISNIQGQELDLKVNANNLTPITLSLMGKTYIIFEPNMISSDVWSSLSDVLKWVAILGALITVFSTI